MRLPHLPHVWQFELRIYKKDFVGVFLTDFSGTFEKIKRTRKIDLRLSVVIFQQWTSLDMLSFCFCLKSALFASLAVYAKSKLITPTHPLEIVQNTNIFSDNCSYCGVFRKKLDIYWNKFLVDLTRNTCAWHFLVCYIVDIPKFESCLVKYVNMFNMFLAEAASRRCFVKKLVLKNFVKFTGKCLHQGLFFFACNFIKKETLCFPVNFVKFLRTRFL